MSALEELRNQYYTKYGTDWDREMNLTEDEHIAWVEACYDYYENEGELSPTYIGNYTDDLYAGEPFEIVERVPVDDDGFDIVALPIWKVRVRDDEFYAYPENLFVNP